MPLASSLCLRLCTGLLLLGTALFSLDVGAGNADVIRNQGCTQDAAGLNLQGMGEDVQLTAAHGATAQNLSPLASLNKTITAVLVTYTLEVCNTSDAEELTLINLMDDIYGDITQLASTSCTVPQTLQPAGQIGECYLCMFQAETLISPITDRFTIQGIDDDGSVPANEYGNRTIVSFE
jgi:hypothetical protein